MQLYVTLEQGSGEDSKVHITGPHHLARIADGKIRINDEHADFAVFIAGKWRTEDGEVWDEVVFSSEPIETL